MAAVNSRKKLYVLLKGPFTETGINEYLRLVLKKKKTLYIYSIREKPFLAHHCHH
jgi:hypothetical protein